MPPTRIRGFLERSPSPSAEDGPIHGRDRMMARVSRHLRRSPNPSSSPYSLLDHRDHHREPVRDAPANHSESATYPSAFSSLFGHMTSERTSPRTQILLREFMSGPADGYPPVNIEPSRSPDPSSHDESRESSPRRSPRWFSRRVHMTPNILGNPPPPPPPFSLDSLLPNAQPRNEPVIDVEAEADASMGNSSAEADQEEDDGFSCPVCYETFVQPKYLSCCGNSICESCETNVVTRGVLGAQSNCPVCGTTGTLRNMLRVNVALKNVLEAKKKRKVVEKVACSEPKCKRMSDLEEVFWCTTCSPTEKIRICSHCGLREHRGHNVEVFPFCNAEKRQNLINEMQEDMKLDAATACFEQNMKQLARAYAENCRGMQKICTAVQNGNTSTEEEVRAELDKAKQMLLKNKMINDSIYNLVHEPEVKAESVKVEEAES